MEGIINILKPPGMTSHDVISFLRRTTGERKIGHCGVLDPEAAGVLPVCLGQATRLADFLSGGEKSYYCEMKLGYETETQDIWGKTTWACPAGMPDPFTQPDRISESARSLVGEIRQEVPAYSSVKREGKSLYKYAREGKPYSGIIRNVSVYSIELVKRLPDDPANAGSPAERGISFIIECGSGTYVRMICRDLGRKLGCGGVMSFLLRLNVGPFRLEDSVTLEEILRRKEGEAPFEDILAPKELALARVPAIRAEDREAAKLRQGQSVWLPAADTGSGSEEEVWVSDRDQRLVALGSFTRGYGERAGQVLYKPNKTFQ